MHSQFNRPLARVGYKNVPDSKTVVLRTKFPCPSSAKHGTAERDTKNLFCRTLARGLMTRSPNDSIGSAVPCFALKCHGTILFGVFTLYVRNTVIYFALSDRISCLERNFPVKFRQGAGKSRKISAEQGLPNRSKIRCHEFHRDYNRRVHSVSSLWSDHRRR